MAAKQAQTETLETGAVNPVIDTRMDKIPPKALLLIGQTLKHGMKYEKDKEDNWRGVPANEHLNHAQRHLALYRAGDRSEDHVGHILVRMMFWAELTI